MLWVLELLWPLLIVSSVCFLHLYVGDISYDTCKTIWIFIFPLFHENISIIFIALYERRSLYFVFLSLGHYRSRASPTAGIVPYLQSTVCNLRNECREEVEVHEDIPTYNGSM